MGFNFSVYFEIFHGEVEKREFSDSRGRGGPGTPKGVFKKNENGLITHLSLIFVKK